MIGRAALCSLVLGLSTEAGAELTRQTDPETGLQKLKLVDGALELELNQLLPIQTRAFFLGRGFTAEIAGEIGASCVFQTIGRNRLDQAPAKPVTIFLKDWRLRVDGKVQGVKLKEDWDAGWSDTQVTPAARIAFRWATFPTEQTFEPNGDYNWGMTSFGLPPQTRFDLNLVWFEGDRRKSIWIPSMQCPADAAEET